MFVSQVARLAIVLVSIGIAQLLARSQFHSHIQQRQIFTLLSRKWSVGIAHPTS
jgi:hypothetical protein